jgi:hypothetical protein
VGNGAEFTLYRIKHISHSSANKNETISLILLAYFSSLQVAKAYDIITKHTAVSACVNHWPHPPPPPFSTSEPVQKSAVKVTLVF